jgi:PIN domain
VIKRDYGAVAAQQNPVSLGAYRNLMPALLFLDTNVLLDFYRLRKRDAGLSILEKVASHKDSLIVTDQVVMEFKKNRQRVLLDTLKNLKAPAWESLSLPPLIEDTQESKAIIKHKNAINSYAKKLRGRLTRAIADPSKHDPVFKKLQSIWRSAGPYHLDRKKPVRLQVRELAKKRFLLGYPPRKDSDTSFGDAVNWEWMIHCAHAANSDLVIVTRDGDYGVNADGEPLLNDWLREEFRDRVGRRRKVTLTDKVTDALKLLSIRVTKNEEKATEALTSVANETVSIWSAEIQSRLRSLIPSGPGLGDPAQLRALLNSWTAHPAKSGSDGA